MESVDAVDIYPESKSLIKNIINEAGALQADYSVVSEGETPLYQKKTAQKLLHRDKLIEDYVEQELSEDFSKAERNLSLNRTFGWLPRKFFGMASKMPQFRMANWAFEKGQGRKGPCATKVAPA